MVEWFNQYSNSGRYNRHSMRRIGRYCSDQLYYRRLFGYNSCDSRSIASGNYESAFGTIDSVYGCDNNSYSHASDWWYLVIDIGNWYRLNRCIAGCDNAFHNRNSDGMLYPANDLPALHNSNDKPRATSYRRTFGGVRGINNKLK